MLKGPTLGEEDIMATRSRQASGGRSRTVDALFDGCQENNFVCGRLTHRADRANELREVGSRQLLLRVHRKNYVPDELTTVHSYR